ncbi:hypothetical protein F5B22DRAFT_232169 [Xylaria bambusicola]|uniref:uncharacterized protein n=1 Tax=Xylaria bambusicola TaxID=326684 RepID=UPI002008A758|nr:uncharacterized protein F5B22DRAFT_232169 [Xylaria bambusicola]KAI0514559.1 hypothetical protein F5B22DRAFT_232169 [Xylaria bambusicola]
MWTRPLTPTLPTPLRSDDMHRRNLRECLVNQDTSDVHPPSPKKNTRYSIHPIFDKYKRPTTNSDGYRAQRLRDPARNQGNTSPVAESHMIKRLNRDYAALRVTLHSNTAKDATEVEAALAVDVEHQVKSNISKLGKIADRERELATSILDCEVDTQISNKDGQKRPSAVHVRSEVSGYQQIEAESDQKLARLWCSWEEAQADIDELSGKLHDLFEHEPSSGTSGMSSNMEWMDKEDLDIDRRIKKVVDDMAACEEDFQQKLKYEDTNIFKAIFQSSFD